jgi:ABC-type bacteriocin/lantibiotic exporter with double-glycine peptidase domain
MKQDVTTALKSMLENAMWFGKEIAIIIFRVALALAIIGVIIYALIHFIWIIAGISVVGVLISWFYVEYSNAKSIREYEELLKKNEKV